MLSTWRCLHDYDDLKHMFFIPCDSHGLQLLIKDLLSLPPLKLLLDQAQAVVKAFHKSRLQLARLREHQITLYSKKQALCIAVITRWGTQYRLINSVLKNKDALRRYAIEQKSRDLPFNSHDCISSAAFWRDFEPV